ncbi:helix-turn-helix transcriptional regulator [Actinomarinicola tropica]|uniref:WYL domain-containing protein n=1 Tax=Actinomarinicola tropica TaxID=2789776 RepID=A0A5Q2RJY4_9ACTN|nr:WYL domain-containing protein [Actinomarinicola tropica]QGG95232.1 WYL domain-containing protein [Actinomarinicola tropica]
MSTAARLLDLLALLQVPRSWPGQELAQRLGVAPRTLRNDVERLRSLGYRIDGVRGPAGGYRLGSGARMPPLLLDEEDVVAVAASLLTQRGHVAGLDESAERALAKLEQIMPPALQRRAAALRVAVVQVPADAPAAPVDAEVLSVVSAACRDHEVLRADYRRHDSATTERRIVEPYRIVTWGRRWYLYAYDTVRRDWRTFRMDRLVPNPPAGPRFAPRPLPVDDVAAHVSRGAAAAAWTHRATVVVLAPAAELAHVPGAAGTIEPLDDRTCRFTTGAEDLRTLAVHLGRLGWDFRVEEPDELRDELRTLAERYARAAG